jgi:hypothetical protein
MHHIVLTLILNSSACVAAAIRDWWSLSVYDTSGDYLWNSRGLTIWTVYVRIFSILLSLAVVKALDSTGSTWGGVTNSRIYLTPPAALNVTWGSPPQAYPSSGSSLKNFLREQFICRNHQVQQNAQIGQTTTIFEPSPGAEKLASQCRPIQRAAIG